MVDRAFTDLKAGRDTMAELPVFAQKFPTPAFASDEFSDRLPDVLPLFMTLSFIYTCAMLVKALVYEREHRLKEAMGIMGMRDVSHWLGWIITSFVQLSFSCAILTVATHSGNILPYSNWTITFVYLECYAFSTVCFALMVSTWFSKAKIAAAAGGLIYFLMYVPFIVAQSYWNHMSFASKVIASLVSTTCFGFGGLYTAEHELLAQGNQWGNVWDGIGGCDRYSFGLSAILLLVDGFLYLGIAAYVTAVFPGEFGVPKHPLFFLRWCCRRDKASGVGPDANTGSLHVVSPADGSSTTARDASGTPEAGIEISGLSKTYASECSSASVDAVQGLDLTMRRGDITTLLGSNGAGKTTTMSIITGIFPPTSGRVVVNGLSTSRDMDAIRRSLGLCPQHDVFFPWMTPDEHLAFCAAMRGVPRCDVEADTRQLLTDLGLSASHDVRASSLSGGQKRKLSVAMAFMGDPAVVVLDEPTAGMDPSARRQTWDAILARRAGRTILLSTHYLDEADLLSDRIAIMSRGQLVCMDTPMGLKRKHGAGYALSVVLKPAGGDGDPALNRRRLDKLVQGHVAKARLVQGSAQEVTYSLPMDRLPRFQGLLEELELRKDDISVHGFGVSAPTMDSVFQAAIALDDKDAVFVPGAVGGDSVGDGGNEGTRKDEAGCRRPPAVTGWRRTWLQAKALFVKRVNHAKRDRKALFSQLVLPVLFMTLAMVVASIVPYDLEQPWLGLTPATYGKFCSKNELPLYAYNASGALGARAVATLNSSTADIQPRNLEGDAQFEALRQRCKAAEGTNKSLSGLCGGGGTYNVSRYLLSTHETRGSITHGAVTADAQLDPKHSGSGFGHSPETTGRFFRAWFDSRDLHSLPQYLNMVNNAVLGTITGDDTLRITTYTQPFAADPATLELEYLRSGVDLIVSIFIIVALAFVPGSFLVYLVGERSTKVRAGCCCVAPRLWLRVETVPSACSGHHLPSPPVTAHCRPYSRAHCTCACRPTVLAGKASSVVLRPVSSHLLAHKLSLGLPRLPPHLHPLLDCLCRFPTGAVLWAKHGHHHAPLCCLWVGHDPVYVSRRLLVPGAVHSLRCGDCLQSLHRPHVYPLRLRIGPRRCA